MVNVLSIALLLGLGVLFIWLASRAWRSRRGWIKWPGVVLSGLLALVFLLVTAVAGLGFYRLNNAPYKYSVSDVKVAMTEEKIARGERAAALCADCHSSTGSATLDGSKDNFFAGGPPLGVLYAPNLTPGGPLKDWTDGEIIRAIREGVDKEGRPLFVMPSQGLHAMSDDDAQAIVAYLRSQPVVNRNLPAKNLSVLTALFVGSGMFPTSAQTPIAGPVVAPERGTADYGLYVTNAFGCRDCHGPDLAGQNGGPAVGPNLTQIVPTWTEEQFIQFFREGKDPTGRMVDPKQMPWKGYGNFMDDSELKGLYAYLHGLQRVEKTAP